MSEIAVLHICLSKGWGGLEMYPIRTGKVLLEKGHQVYGLATDGTQTISGMKENGLNVFAAKSKTALITTQLFTLIGWIRKNNITVIHCHKSGDLLVAAIIKQFINLKVIFTEHMGVKRPKKDLFHQWVYKHVDQVLSISDETYQRNISALPVTERKIQRLWLGTDIPELITDPDTLRALKNTYSISENKTLIGIVGRLSPGKGHLNLVKAFAKVKQHHSDSMLVIVGGLKAEQGADSEYLSQLQELIKEHNLIDDVLFTGFCNNIHELYSIMDIVCLPYANEAFGLTAIEAMAAGRPVVAANTGALPEILDDTGYYCNPNSDEEIADTILQVLNNTDKAGMQAQRARARAEKEFSLDTHIQKLIGFYS